MFQLVNPQRPYRLTRVALLGVLTVTAALTGCTTTNEPPATSATQTPPIPTPTQPPSPVADAYAMRDRSIEIQRIIFSLIPTEYTTNHDSRTPGHVPIALLTCEPILADDFHATNPTTDPEGVTYPGYFSVLIDEGAPYEQLLHDLYTDTVAHPDINIDTTRLPTTYEDGTQIITTDGFVIALSTARSRSHKSQVIRGSVWSPCFIPEAETPHRI